MDAVLKCLWTTVFFERTQSQKISFLANEPQHILKNHPPDISSLLDQAPMTKRGTEEILFNKRRKKPSQAHPRDACWLSSEHKEPTVRNGPIPGNEVVHHYILLYGATDQVMEEALEKCLCSELPSYGGPLNAI